MKKQLSIILLLFLYIGVNGQDADSNKVLVTNKNGKELLPKAGDFSLGLSANPFLEYLGGFMGGNSPVAPKIDGYDGSIYGKYFLEDNFAVRLKLDLNIGKEVDEADVQDDKLIALDPLNKNIKQTDKHIYSDNIVNVSLGAEWRRGRSRVQGYYGGEVTLGTAWETSKYVYGNEITLANQTPSITDFGGSNSNTSPEDGYRLLKESNSYCNLGLGGFVGVEYFFTQLVSIGCEFNLSAYYISALKNSEFTSEGIVDDKIIEYDYTGVAKGRIDRELGFSLRPAGEFYLSFCF